MEEMSQGEFEYWENKCSEHEKIKIKTKVTKAEIVVRGTKEKPYFEIAYTELDGSSHVGYGSYNLDFVFEWKDSEFEVAK